METRTIEQLSELQIEDLRDLYHAYTSWEDRTLDDVRTAIEFSNEVVGLCPVGTDELIACARVLTDYTYYGTVYDVIISTDHRREGLGTRLMSEVIEHPALRSIDLYLGARDGLVPFYEACGFETRRMTIGLDDREEDLDPMVYRRG